MSGDIHTLSGAYAVDAVDDIERMQFVRHLAECPTCHAEVASLREGAAQLAEVSASTPSAALRSQVLASIATVRPLPPLSRIEEARRSASRRRFPALVAAAAALVVIGGAGSTVWHPWQDSSSISASEVEQVLHATDRQSVPAKLAGDASAVVTRSSSLNLAIVQTENLPTLPAGMVYEMWLRHGTEPLTRAGVLPEGGSRTYVLSGDAAGANYAGITVEPAPGSDTPTSLPIANFTFESA